MLIKPTQTVPICIKHESVTYESFMVSLTETELELSCTSYIEQGSVLNFQGKFFKGKGHVKRLEFNNFSFNYIIEIEAIQFQPGLLINTRL